MPASAHPIAVVLVPPLLLLLNAHLLVAQDSDTSTPPTLIPNPPTPPTISAGLNTTMPTISTISTTPVPLVLQACCGNQCEQFQRPEEMYGIKCCGNEVINHFDEICCNNVPRRRRQSSSFIDRCCGNQTLAYDQTCCKGVVHNIPSGECCGQAAYARNAFNVLCCEEQLLTNMDPSLTCCGKTAYDGGKREICCGGRAIQKDMFDGCCALYGKDPPEYQEFNTRTHQCCDKPIDRASQIKCCYLKDAQGHFFPTSYNATTHCCNFPFINVTERSNNGTCIAG